MYLNFYNLRSEPFRITPDPDFLFLSPSHLEALATITYAAEQGKGFMVLVGEVGLGKTTLLQTFLQERLGAKEKIIYIFNSRLSYPGMLRALARELDWEVVGHDPEVLLDQVFQGLIREYARGNNVILLIDEAQGLPEETLEGLRLISNLETPTEKLLQIVLVGQPELSVKLDKNELRQLRQRIAAKAVLSPLTRKESREYIRFRLKKAGGRVEDIFTPRALEKIVRQGRGIPRALNILADNALVTGFGYQQKPVPLKVIKEVIANLGGRWRPFTRRLALAASLTILLLVLGVMGVSIIHSPSASRSKASISLPVSDQAAGSFVKDSGKGEIRPASGIQSSEDPEIKNQESRDIPLERKAGAPRIREEEPAPAGDRPGQKPESFPFTRKVRKGETLYRITREIYGLNNPKLLDLVKEQNPWIKEDFKIRPGQAIIFPEWKAKEKTEEQLKIKDSSKPVVTE
jgi:general secretion pathway protein A